jgi:glycine betaine/proline transport system ATP-binding protein
MGANVTVRIEQSLGNAADAASPMVVVSHLWKVFGVGRPDRALALSEAGADRARILAETGQTIGVRDVSFDVGRGETFVVMGLSGSGKSTLVRCISRLVEPTKGAVTIDGDDVLAMGDERLRAMRRTKMAMVFQHFGLFPHRRVIDNVAYGLEVQGIAKAERRARAGVVLEIVGLSAWASHYPQQLSGGMQQRVGLARALALDPQVLFFDEPFSALDPLIRRDMQAELLALQETMHRTIVFITHDFAEALRLGDRIAIMKDGVFDQVGTSEEIVARPATDYVREFTTDIPKSKVLTVRSVMHAGETNGVRRVPSHTKIGQLIPLLLDSGDPICVVDEEGQPLGIVDRDSVAALLGDESR